MVDMMNTDFKPGDIVQHPEHGYGVVLKNFPGVPTIYFAGKHGYENTTRGFTGWERVETNPRCPKHGEKPTSATVTLPEGTSEKWLRVVSGDWANADDGLATWAYLCQRGTVTLGWDE